MKKLCLFLAFIILLSSVSMAFSVRDFLTNFKDYYSRISGADIAQFNPNVCSQGSVRCNEGNECGSSPCVMQCQNNAWVEYQYCAQSCSNGQCVNNQINQMQFQVCTQGQLTCNTCNGSPCVMQCQNNAWVEYQYCAQSCSNGQCVNNLNQQEFQQQATPIPEDNQINQQCSDQTLYNQCSINKPYFCSNGNLIENCNTCGCPTGKECQNNQCIIKREEPYDPGGREDEKEGNEKLLNIPPRISPIEEKTLKISQEIKFDVSAIDQNNDPLVYSFDNNERRIITELVECSISESTARCKGLKEGREMIKIIVSDKINNAEKIVIINILKELPLLKKGVAAGIGNTAPVADAGSDIIGIPGQKIILDASKSYDYEGFLSVPDTYQWYKEEVLLGSGKNLEKIFNTGSHKIRLIVTDSEGLTDEDEINVIIKEKLTCKNTKTPYYPEDTLCNSKWPVKEGDEFKINSLTEGSCSLFEVCSEEIDSTIEDSIDCCSDKSMNNPGKTASCNFAKENSNTFRNCQAIYLIKSLGKEATYMEGYFDAEMCCKGVTSLCPKESYLYSAQPLPEWLVGRGLKCSNNPENNPEGLWRSDTNHQLNEIALSDTPAHVSLSKEHIGSGTCVDYSVAATTLLRKIGFSKEDVMTVEASNHAYNLIRFDLDRKYTLFDMTGNNEGLKPGKVPQGYEYCQNIINCYNDNGKIDCPGNKNIIGCENVKENIGRKTGVVGNRIKNSLISLFEKIKAEVLR